MRRRSDEIGRRRGRRRRRPRRTSRKLVSRRCLRRSTRQNWDAGHAYARQTARRRRPVREHANKPAKSAVTCCKASRRPMLAPILTNVAASPRARCLRRLCFESLSLHRHMADHRRLDLFFCVGHAGDMLFDPFSCAGVAGDLFLAYLRRAPPNQFLGGLWVSFGVSAIRGSCRVGDVASQKLRNSFSHQRASARRRGWV